MPGATAQSDAFDNNLTFKFAAGATCFLVYDTVLHVADEVCVPFGLEFIIALTHTGLRWQVEYIWRSILAMIAASDAGHAWKPTQFVVEAILIVRIYALFNHNVPILTLIAVLYVGEITAMVTVLALSIPKMTFTSHCLHVLLLGSGLMPAALRIISLSFETLLFALTIIKFCTSISHSALGRGSILFVLVRDGTWAYAIIFVIMLTNTLLYHLVDNPLAGLCFLALTFSSICGVSLRSIWTAGSADTMQFTPRSTFMSDRMSDNDIELHCSYGVATIEFAASLHESPPKPTRTNCHLHVKRDHSGSVNVLAKHPALMTATPMYVFQKAI
ncbi:predicted protein [Postia placenta Mad-698-R]|nr:predicted protein [Postia placenta Mad-698-R]